MSTVELLPPVSTHRASKHLRNSSNGSKLVTMEVHGNQADQKSEHMKVTVSTEEKLEPQQHRTSQPSNTTGSVHKYVYTLLSSEDCSMVLGYPKGWLTMTMTMTMTHSEKSNICQMKAWPYRQECRGHDPTKKNLLCC